MELKKQLSENLKTAMKQKDEVGKKVIRMVLSTVKLIEVEKGKALDNQEMIGIIHKEIKTRQESISDAEKAGRDAFIVETNEEIKLLEQYLPPALPPEALTQMAQQAIEEAGAGSIREMGQVMKILVPRLQGRATAAEASQVVRKLLA